MRSNRSNLLTIEQLNRDPKAQAMVREMDVAQYESQPTFPDDDTVPRTHTSGNGKSVPASRNH
jgi:hypothetical protein